MVLTPTLFRALKANQIGALEVEDIIALPSASMKAISTTALPSLNSLAFAEIDPTIISKLSPSQIGALTSQQISMLGDYQVFDMTGSQLKAISAHNAHAFTELAIASIGGMNGGKIIKDLNIAEFSASQINALSGDQAGYLTQTQLATLTSNNINGLTANQIQQMTPASFSGIGSTDKSVLPYLGVLAVGAISYEQISRFSTAQLEALTSFQVSKLDSSITDWLTNTKKYSVITSSDTVLGGIKTSSSANVQGGSGNDTIYAGSGNNTITSGAGDDIIYAGNGNNMIAGDTGNDSIRVGNGNNTIMGGAGIDVIYGGGRNLYSFNTNDSTVGSIDLIVDGKFDGGNADKMTFQGLTASPTILNLNYLYNPLNYDSINLLITTNNLNSWLTTASNGSAASNVSHIVTLTQFINEKIVIIDTNGSWTYDTGDFAVLLSGYNNNVTINSIFGF
jgi:hypothetical protein